MYLIYLTILYSTVFPSWYSIYSNVCFSPLFFFPFFFSSLSLSLFFWWGGGGAHRVSQEGPGEGGERGRGWTPSRRELGGGAAFRPRGATGEQRWRRAPLRRRSRRSAKNVSTACARAESKFSPPCAGEIWLEQKEPREPLSAREARGRGATTTTTTATTAYSLSRRAAGTLDSWPEQFVASCAKNCFRPRRHPRPFHPRRRRRRRRENATRSSRLQGRRCSRAVLLGDACHLCCRTAHSIVAEHHSAGAPRWRRCEGMLLGGRERQR